MKFVAFAFAVLLFANLSASAELTTTIGVIDGDTAMYTLDDYRHYIFSDGMNMTDTDSFVFVTEDDAFEMEVMGIETEMDAIPISISMDDSSIDAKSNMSLFFSYVVYADWDYWETYLGNIWKYRDATINNGKDLFEFSVTYEAIMNMSMNPDMIGLPHLFTFEANYEKTTGIKTFYHERVSMNNDTMVMKDFTYSADLTKGVFDVPGFELLVALVTVMAIPIYRRRQ